MAKLRRKEKMEALKPGIYRVNTSRGPAHFNYSQSGGSYPHEFELGYGCRNEGMTRGAIGVDFEGALAGFDYETRVQIKKRLGETLTMHEVHERMNIVADEVKAGIISVDQAGLRVKDAVGSFIRHHQEKLSPLVSIAPSWRLDTQTGSLEQPWIVDNFRESYRTWFTHRGLVARALANNIRRNVR